MLVKVIAIAAIGYGLFYYYQAQQNPWQIDAPVYAEFRVDMKAAGQTLNAVLIGKSVDQNDCEQRAQKVWRETLEGCAACTFKSAECKTDIGSRYEKLFDNRSTYTSYVSFNRGSRFERDGRMIVWGLNDKDSRTFCELMKSYMRKGYSGEVRCVFGRGI